MKIFFKIFDFPLRGKGREHALEDPNSIILTRKTAEKFFGDKDPVGRYFSIDSLGEYIIAGIIPETDQKSHIQFDVLLPVESMKKDQSENWDNIYSS